ncbi:ABC transporter permease [Reinekea blandensis]|uniref:Iron compound ABC transporter, permease protein n=1 Tax=Reinekea blandensis MED297 TaxID=314283 RepID=A4BFY1_9GAMM|nr:iron chelate uptake ABC transporter family permease subunit [Reinekea blandensis]EAR08999.1 iron compound ABC transporter, permease protein [Reinekea sp. MED297] [Reinekea blandensis MED297]
MKAFLLTLGLVAALAVISLFVGVADLSASEENYSLLFLTRIPRTLAVLLAGSSLAIAGVIMQMLARNKFVEPTTTGTVEWATLGILLLLIFAPESSVMVKLIVACLFAVVGAVSFLFLLSRIRIQSEVIVPLVGIMYSGIMSSTITFIAFQYDLIQSIWTWIQGDFSMIMRGRYELLWLSGVLCIAAYITANQFTLVGLGESVAKNLGVNYRWIVIWGVCMVAVISGITVVNAGVIPFLGLVVPNLVSVFMGDNLRKSLPWIALIGAGLVLACDLLARTLRYPYEVPIGIIMGVFGSVIFLSILLHRNRQYD